MAYFFGPPVYRYVCQCVSVHLSVFSAVLSNKRVYCHVVFCAAFNCEIYYILLEENYLFVRFQHVGRILQAIGCELSCDSEEPTGLPGRIIPYHIPLDHSTR